MKGLSAVFFYVLLNVFNSLLALIAGLEGSYVA